MKKQPLRHQLLFLFLLALIACFPLTAWNLGSCGIAYAAEKKVPAQEKHGHDHSDGEEEHDDHEEKDEHGHGKEKKEEAHGHGHGEEEGHGDHEEEEGGARFGPGKAITAANKKDGIQLSEKAVKTLGLNYISVTGDGIFKIPVKSAVFFKDEVGVYRFRHGWHKLIDVELVSKTATEAVVKTSEIKSGDQIAKDGVPLLRAAELEAWGGSGDGHGH